MLRRNPSGDKTHTADGKMLPGFTFGTVFSFTVYLGMMATATTVTDQNEFWFECYMDDFGREHYRTNYRICSSQFETITIRLCHNFTILSDILSAIVTKQDDVSLSITVDRPMVILDKVVSAERISKLTIYVNNSDAEVINLEKFVNLKTLNLTGNCARQLGRSIRFSSSPSSSSNSNYGLKLLDLSKNNLTLLPDGYPTNRLETLIATDNFISYDRRFFTSTLPHSILTGLDLTNNLLGNLSDVALHSNTLQWLNISGNGVNDISTRTFVGLSRLEELIMNDNRLTDIDENAFVGNFALRKLSLRNNQLTELAEGTFQNLTELRFLDLSKNNLIRLNPGTFQFLDNLSDLILSENKQFSTIVPEPPQTAGRVQFLLAAQRLETVRLDRLNLSTFPITLTRSVRLLDLSANDYTAIRWGDLDGYPLLQTLKLQSNKIELIEYDVLGRLDYLETVQLDRNRLKRVPRSLAESLKVLQLSRNRIDEIDEDDFYGLSELEELFLNSNRISSIAPGSLNPLNKLLVLDLSDNPLISLNTLSSPPVSLEVLSLAGLRDYDSVVENIESQQQQQLPGVFPILEMSGIRKLNLSRSVILTDLLINDAAILNTMRRVEELDLTETNVTTVPEQLKILTPHLRLLKVSVDKSRVSCSLPNNDYVINDNRNWRVNSRKLIKYPRSKTISISSDYYATKPGSLLPLNNCEIREIEHRHSIDHVKRCALTDDDVVESRTEQNRKNIDHYNNRTETSFERTWYRIFGNSPDAKFVASVDNDNHVNADDYPRLNDKIKKRTIFTAVPNQSFNGTEIKPVNYNASSLSLRNSTLVKNEIRNRTNNGKQIEAAIYTKTDLNNNNNNITIIKNNNTTNKISLTSANLNKINFFPAEMNRTGNNQLNYTFTEKAKQRFDHPIISKLNGWKKTETDTARFENAAKIPINEITSRNNDLDSNSVKSAKAKKSERHVDIASQTTNLTNSSENDDSDNNNESYAKKEEENRLLNECAEFQNVIIAPKKSNNRNDSRRIKKKNRKCWPLHDNIRTHNSDHDSINGTRIIITSKGTTTSSSKISSEDATSVNASTVNRSNVIAKTTAVSISMETVTRSIGSSIDEKRLDKRKAFAPLTTNGTRNQSTNGQRNQLTNEQRNQSTSTTGLEIVSASVKLNTMVLSPNGSNRDSDWSIVISKESSDSFSDVFVSNETDAAKNGSRSESVKAMVPAPESKILSEEDDQSALTSNETAAHPGLIIFGIVLLIVSVFLSPMVISTWLQTYRRKKKRQQQNMRTSISSDMLDDMTVMEIRSVSTITETELW